MSDAPAGGAAHSGLMRAITVIPGSGQHVRHRIVCLTGVSSAGTESVVDPGLLNRNMVLHNSVLFGSVNANRRHYEQGASALAAADRTWLADLIARRVPLSDWARAYTREPGDIKTVLEFTA